MAIVSFKYGPRITLWDKNTYFGNYGYWAAGSRSGVDTARIDRIVFPSDTLSIIAATLTSTVGAYASYANSGYATGAGYAAGGYAGAFVSRIDKLRFSDEVKSTLSATLSTARYSIAGFANSGTAGYAATGNQNGTLTTTIDKLLFSNETNSALSETISNGRMYANGFGNTGTAGYVFGGNANSGGRQSDIQKLLYSNDTRSILSATLGQVTQSPVGAANVGVAGYSVGGFSQSPDRQLTVIDKLLFSNETRSTLTYNLVDGRNDGTAFAQAGKALYATTGDPQRNYITKISFPTDTGSVVSATFSGVVGTTGGFSNCAG
jgi:hypothetical protein